MSHRGWPNDFYQFWTASGALAHGISPYDHNVTERNQLYSLGQISTIPDDQIFPYPAYAALPMIPLSLLPFKVVDVAAILFLGACLFFLPAALRLRFDLQSAALGVFALGCTPIAVALEMRQPSIAFLAISVAALTLVRLDQMHLAGIAAALASEKPQITLVVLLPIGVWALTDWNRGKKFVLSFALSLSSLIGVSFVLSPDWLSRWLSVLKTYKRVTMHPSLVGQTFGSFATVATAAILFLLVVVLWANRHRDLLTLSAISAPIVYAVGPFVDYNSILLVIPVVWMVDRYADLPALPLKFVTVSLAGLFLTPAIGLLLLRSAPEVSWAISEIMVLPLLLSTIALMGAAISGKSADVAPSPVNPQYASPLN